MEPFDAKVWAKQVEESRRQLPHHSPIPPSNHGEEALSVECQMRYFLNPQSLPIGLIRKQIEHMKVCKACRVAQERFAQEPRDELIAWLED